MMRRRASEAYSSEIRDVPLDGSGAHRTARRRGLIPKVHKESIR